MGMSGGDDEVESEAIVSRRHDPAVQAAKARLMEDFFPEDGSEVYYGRQLEIWLEVEFFHWITKKGLNELRDEGRISFEEVVSGGQRAHFYWPRKHRYPR